MRYIMTYMSLFCGLFMTFMSYASAPIINVYVPNWGVYNNNPINSSDTIGKAALVNTVTYAFMYINRSGQIVSSDSYADTNLNQLQQFASLSVKNHLLSIGGGGFAGWGPALQNPQAFVNSIAKYTTVYGINGIDFDYEPSLNRNSTTSVQMMNLVKAVRTAYPNFVITYTIQSGNVGLTAINAVGSTFWKTLSQNNVYVQLMNYDFFGTWEPRTMLLSGLNYVPPILTALNANGLPNAQVILGIPMYGVNATNVSAIGLGAYYNGGGQYSKYSAIIAQNLNIIDVPMGNYIAGSYENNTSTRTFYTFDSVNSVLSKSHFVLDNGMGGTMFWEVSGDMPANDSRSLLGAAFSVLSVPIGPPPPPPPSQQDQFNTIVTAADPVLTSQPDVLQALYTALKTLFTGAP